jgi:transcriptional regulator with XRE-family HTH domain
MHNRHGLTALQFLITSVAMLNDYLTKQNISRADFARKLGVTGQAVSRWIGGQSIPRPETQLTVSEITHGEVPLEYWALAARARAAKE